MCILFIYFYSRWGKQRTGPLVGRVMSPLEELPSTQSGNPGRNKKRERKRKRVFFGTKDKTARCLHPPSDGGGALFFSYWKKEAAPLHRKRQKLQNRSWRNEMNSSFKAPLSWFIFPRSASLTGSIKPKTQRRPSLSICTTPMFHLWASFVLQIFNWLNIVCSNFFSIFNEFTLPVLLLKMCR